MLGTLLIASQTWKMCPCGAFLIPQVPRDKYFPQVCSTARAGLAEALPVQCDVTMWCDVTVQCSDSPMQCDVTVV